MKTRKMILRLIAMLGLFALLVVPASPAAAADTQVSIGVPAQVPESSNFIVRINVDAVTDFDVAQYDITYNPAVIEVTDVTDGSIGGTTIPVSSWGYIPSGTQGTIRVINNIPGTPGVTGSGYLAEIHFHVVGATGATSSIDLHGDGIDDGILGDKDAHPIPATWTDGSVEVIAAVTTDFSASPREVLVNQDVAFTAIITGGSGSYTYAWDFGDSGTSDQANPTHSYAAIGNYTVALTVTDAFDGSDTETKPDYITVYPALVAGFSADINEAVVEQIITFNSGATAGGKTGYTYAWDFDDSQTSTDTNPTHSYTDSDTYNVTLTVTDDLGNTDDATVTVTVYKLGDADKSGLVNALDITYIEHVIMGDAGYIETTWADANEDGDWNALDITATELIILGP
jgi:PKD repeat protein